MAKEEKYLTQLFENDLLYLLDTENSVDQSPKVSAENAQTKNIQNAEDISSNETAKTQEPKETVKPVLILVEPNFSETEKETLDKILNAINRSPDEVQLIQEHPDTLKDLNRELFISFHDDFVKEQDYKVSKINKTSIIYSHAISSLNKDKNKKIKLWNLLKQFS